MKSKAVRKVKAAVALGAASALALGLAGCSSGSGTSASGETHTITMFMWTSSQAEVDSWNAIASMVTEEYPDITVDFETADWSNYWTKLVADASGSSSPCLVGIQSLRLPGVSDLLEPLDDVMESNGIDSSDFNESILDAMQVDGEQKVIPYDFGPLVMYYNADAFAAAGLETPSNDWTVEDFEKDIAALSGNGTYGTVFDANADYTLPWTLNLGGVQAVDDSGNLAMSDSSYQSALSTLSGWVSSGYAPQLSASSSTSALDQFIAGNAMTTIDGPWNLINTNSTANFTVGIAPVPAGDGGQSSVTEGSGFGITQGCSDKDSAAKALSVITGAEAASTLASEGRAFPARTAQQSDWLSNVSSEAADALEYAEEHTEAQKVTDNWTSVVDAFTQYGVEAFNGSTSMADFASSVETAAKE